MQTTAAAEAARNAEGTEQRRQAHLATIRARESAEADELRELAKLDIKDIDGWSDEEIKRIKAERERRIATRREQLQHRLEDHRAVISREIDAVEAAIGTYRVKVDAYFARINNENDPVAIAREAGNQPQFPDLEQIKPDHAPSAVDDRLTAGEETVIAEAVAEQVVDGPADGGETAEAAGEVPQDETQEQSFLVGVMDPDASAHPFETPWESGVAVEEVAEGGDEAVAAEAEGVEAEAVEPSRSCRGRSRSCRGRRGGRRRRDRRGRRGAGAGRGRGARRHAAKLGRRIVAPLAEQLVARSEQQPTRRTRLTPGRVRTGARASLSIAARRED